MAVNNNDYYFNVETHEIEQGKQSDWVNRIGPFPSYEEASAALNNIKTRNEAWDAEDEEWNS